MRSRACLMFAVCIATSLFVGCGPAVVPVEGIVSIDGEPLTNGRLILNPKGGEGTTAFSNITETGAYRLQCVESTKGIMPGKYSVMVKFKPELTAKQKKSIERQASGLSLEELSVSFTSPEKEPVVIPEEGDTSFSIDISRKAGWQKMVGD